MTTWINVKDRLPEPETACLVVTKIQVGKPEPVIVGRYRVLGQSRRVCWLSIPGDWSSAVTHWMELPALPGV